MNCRRTNSLLSAYLDGELAGRETGEIRAHLGACYSCQNEYETLRTTKQMVASLSLKVPREELETLLIVQGRRHEVVRTESPFALRAAAWFLNTHPLELQSSEAWQIATGFLRPRPLVATALLSLTGFWVASSALNSSAFRERTVAENNWYAAPNAYGSEMMQTAEAGRTNGDAAAYPSGYMAASSLSGLRPAAALAVWLAPRSEAGGNENAVSLPVVAATNNPATWQAQRGQNGTQSPSAFMPAPPSGGTNGLLPVSLSGH